MVGEFLPAIRQLVARRLRRDGLSQGKIAALLGVTQASVSHYVSSGPERAYASLARFSVGKDTAEGYAAVLGEAARRSPAYAVETLEGIWSGIVGRGLACDAHREAYPGLAGCDVCVKEFERRGEARAVALSEVAQAVKEIEASSTFADVMPEVSVNLACVSENSVYPEDVVAIPGRIVRVKGAPVAAHKPEFGASRHMAGVLLLVRSRRPDLRAAMNLRYDGRMAAVVAKLRLRPLRLGVHPEAGQGDPTVDALARTLSSAVEPFDAVVDEGGRGIEPNLYLFGKGAVEVARLGIKASEMYSAG